MSATEDKVNEVLANSSTNGEGAELSAPSHRGRGRPKLPRDEQGRIIRDGTEERKTPEKTSKKFVYSKDTDSAQAYGKAAQWIWNFASPMLKVRPITKEESLELGELLDPVLQRWIPIIDDWKYEMALVSGLFVLGMKCREEYVEGENVSSET